MHEHAPLTEFHGDRLRLARMLASISLDELGGMVGVSRQFVHRLETNTNEPTGELRAALAAALDVTPNFFAAPVVHPVREDDCHFRRLATAPRTILAQAAARGTIVEALVDALDRRLRLPSVDFPEATNPSSMEEVERIAEEARRHWRLGLDAPITSMTRVVENAGAVVVHFDDISDRIDALSIARRRPLIVRSSAKTAAVRLRFDLAHEAGHLVMHQGITTGDKATEEQAHRFASAFLIPRTAFAKEFPRTRRILDWAGLFGMKRRWKVSVRAIVRRAFDLGLIDAAQYRTANVHLVKTGQAKTERYDDAIEPERPELLHSALEWLTARDLVGLHRMLTDFGMTVALFSRMTGFEVPPLPSNVVAISQGGGALCQNRRL
jgi:Zn-dependent peptidase ImmA (M78 family)/DNA-binding XRE family transcriptional regulator